MTEIANETPDTPEEKKPEPFDPPKAPAIFEKGDIVTFKEKKAQITLAFDDGTYDVQFIDDAGEALRDVNNQPYWFPKVPAAELSLL